MLNISNFLNAFKQRKVNKLKYEDLGIRISESGWHLINHSNSVPRNATPPSLAIKFEALKIASTRDPRYNFLVHPSTISETTADHVLVTIPETLDPVTEENFPEAILGFVKSHLVGERKRSGTKVNLSDGKTYIALQVKKQLERFEIELVDRHKLPNQPRSTHVKIQYDMIYEEFFAMHTSQESVIVSFSATSENIDHYRRVMFEIVDSIELRS